MEEKKNSLLIVDDESSNLKVLVHILSDEYIIYTAESGESAVEKVRDICPDLILLDIVLPGMDGYETISKIREIEELQKTPVIIITGLDSQEDEEKGLSNDAADYITKPFSDSVVKLRVRNQIQIVNQLRSTESLSLMDQLTNIPNRRSSDARLSVEWKQAIREQTPISILMMDLDKFKILNDTYGHQQGDLVLKKIADILKLSLKRPADFTARWGGEEFVVLLPNTPIEGAMEVAENIRHNIENTQIEFPDGVVVSITISIGVNTQIPTKDCSIITFLSDADKALYRAKDAGRNKVIPHISNHN